MTSATGHEAAVGALNAWTVDAAERAFLGCCGSVGWARAMTAARPFVSVAALVDAADRIWADLEPADWREAFAAHPRIGETSRKTSGETSVPERHASQGRLSGGHGEWSAEEQSGVRDASTVVRLRLAAANREYDERFGYRFIICATGRSAEAMFEDLARRLTNDPEQELKIAAEEQRKITRVRIGKLLESMSAES